jgi:hypothetical protein
MVRGAASVHRGAPSPSPEVFTEESGPPERLRLLGIKGVEKFLVNADAMFEQADSDAAQWEVFLLTLTDLFDNERFGSRILLKKWKRGRWLFPSRASPNVCANRCRTFLQTRQTEPGVFQRRLGKCFAERIGRRFGESQVFLERADEVRKAKVQRWQVVRS